MNTFHIFIEMFMNIFESFRKPNHITKLTEVGEVVVQTIFFFLPFFFMFRVLDPPHDNNTFMMIIKNLCLAVSNNS